MTSDKCSVYFLMIMSLKNSDTESCSCCEQYGNGTDGGVCYNQSSCTVCPAGHYQNLTGQVNCESCPIGQSTQWVYVDILYHSRETRLECDLFI